MIGKLLSNGDVANSRLYKMMTSEKGQLYFGNTEHAEKTGAKIAEQVAEKKYGGAALSVGKAIVDNYTGADFAGQGSKRAKAVALRAGVDIGTGAALEGGIRYATGSGSFTEKDGKRDIAGIPFI